ncbi:hypothetical protein CN235_34755, partial [Sinorhizobium meliloti]
NGSRQRHSSPSSLASGSSTDETGPPHRIPDSPLVPLYQLFEGAQKQAADKLLMPPMMGIM